MNIHLLIPSQKSIYSIMYEVCNDLSKGLTDLGINNKIVEIRSIGNAKFPFYPVNELEFDDLYEYIQNTSAQDTYYVTVDDLSILRWLEHKQTINNMLIWLHYFYGAKYFFKSYRVNRKPLNDKFSSRIIKLTAGMIPSDVAITQSTFYWRTLSRYPLFSQSLWTGMLTERVYSIPIQGTVYTPIDVELFTFPPKTERDGILVFLGDASDTDLQALWEIINALQSEHFGNIDYFGDESSGTQFKSTYGIKMNFIGKLNRKELIKQYASHIVTITPVFNGNFEMVPIQSLLAGTPVISFMQPFIEVTGNSDMIANINNIGEIRRKAKLWVNASPDIRNKIKIKILKVMDSRKIANDLLNTISDLSNH